MHSVRCLTLRPDLSTHCCYSAHRQTVTHRNKTSSSRQYSTSPPQRCSHAVHCYSSSSSPWLHYIAAANLSGLQEHDSSHFTARYLTAGNRSAHRIPLRTSPACGSFSVSKQSSNDRTPRVSNSTSEHAHGHSLALRDHHSEFLTATLWSCTTSTSPHCAHAQP